MEDSGLQTLSHDEMYCSSCGTVMKKEALMCPSCQVPNTRINHSQPLGFTPTKSKIAAGVLGILLGSFGVHKFYLNSIGLGILYLVFCWTGIPGIIGIIEGIIYLTMDDRRFAEKYDRAYTK